jgi:hypothetical protein
MKIDEQKLKIVEPHFPIELLRGADVTVVFSTAKQIPGNFQINEIDKEGFCCSIGLPATNSTGQVTTVNLKLDQEAFAQIKAEGAVFYLNLEDVAALKRLKKLSGLPNFSF